MKPIPEVSQDFDRIAEALRKSSPSERLSPSERWLLRRVPKHARTAVDVGCGDGRFARALARSGLTVLAIDASMGMIELATTRTPAGFAVEYRIADIAKDALPADSFDVAVSIAMVHHLRLKEIVPKLAQLVVPGGTLLIQDVTNRRGITFLASNAIATIRSRLRRWTLGSTQCGEAAMLYREHGERETYLSPSEARSAYERLLRGATVKNHIEWRYSVVWRRPSNPK